MGLNAVLVDRARVWREQADPVKIEGRARMTPVTFEWFRARLTLPASPEQQDTNRGRRKTVPNPTLMFGVKDLSGAALDVRASDQLEVASPQLGTAMWRVSQDPGPIRKKRRVIGYEVVLERLKEPVREMAVP